MRRMIGLAALLLAGQAGAQGPAAGAPLRPSEVALHIVAHGEVVTRADRITLSVTVTGHGPTLPEARTAANAGVARVTAALVAAGIDRASVVTPAGTRLSLDDSINRSAMMVQAMADGNISSGRRAQRTATASLQTTVPDRSTLDRATQVIMAQDGANAGTPKPMLRDEALARRAAVAAAIDHARHEADDYAAPLGLRVARVAAVSNAAGVGDGVAELADVFNRLQDRDKAADSVTTHATAVVDFVLARR